MHNSKNHSPYQTKRQFSTGRLTNEQLVLGQRSYRFEQRLHMSDLNAVYLATDLTTNEQVIIKEVSYRNWQPNERVQAAQLLKDEGEMLRLAEQWQLPAPRYRYCFQWQQHLYLVMSFVAGETLEALVEQGKLTPTQVVSLISDLSKIVEVLHQYGYVHGDIKPANIIVQPNGRPLLIDYGSAQRIRPAGDSQFRGTGTREFMSIEQARGESLATNDQVSLALTLAALVAQPNRQLASVIDRTIGPIERRYSSLSDFRRALSGVNNRRSGKTLSAGQLRPHALLIAAIVLTVLYMSLSLAPSFRFQVLSPTFQSQPIDAPLKPILGPQAEAQPVPPVVLSTSYSAIAAPVAADDVLRMCYEQYQRSREAVFVSLQIERLQCVEPNSPLWNYVAEAVSELQAQDRRRYITQSSTITELTIQPDGEAVIRVEKVDTRTDLPAGCDSPVVRNSCEAKRILKNERYQVIFYAHLTSAGWRLYNVRVLS